MRPLGHGLKAEGVAPFAGRQLGDGRESAHKRPDPVTSSGTALIRCAGLRFLCVPSDSPIFPQMDCAQAGSTQWGAVYCAVRSVPSGSG
jgi:hypothetical protein